MTSYFEVLTDQHAKIREKMERIDFLRKNNGDPSTLSREISQFSGLLNVHLTMEDKVMYPKLLNHDDESIRKLASRFKDEMGDLVNVWKDYAKEWMLASNIRANLNEFNEQTDRIFSVLRERVDREDKELYPLVSAI